MERPIILEMKNICKEYYGNPVLSGINLRVGKGEIHALLGENGAGKSTLMNILFGMSVIHTTGGYTGDILIKGEDVSITSPKNAIDFGLGMVHQEFMLIPGFTITENIKLNREILKPNIFSRIFGKSLMKLDVDSMEKDTRKVLSILEMDDLNGKTLIQNLPVGYMQFVEIARELDKEKMQLLIFDEPTAVLTESESEKLLSAITRLSGMGISILFITHKLEEVMAVADKITILKDGKCIDCLDKTDCSVELLAELMVGRKQKKIVKDKTTSEKINSDNIVREPALKIENLFVHMPGARVSNLSLDIPAGKIYGIGGLAGQGKIGIANGIMGIFPAKGTVFKNGEPLPLNDPASVLRSGIAFVSEDRRSVGLQLDESIEMNIALTAIHIQHKFLTSFAGIQIMDIRKIRKYALKMIDLLDIRCSGPQQPVRRLSGGNQQKVCLARAIALEPQILIVSEPTRGIDVGAKKLVLEFLMKLNRDKGMTVIVISSELAELKSICDEIAIISDGNLEGILSPEADDIDFGLMLSGAYKKRTKGVEAYNDQKK